MSEDDGGEGMLDIKVRRKQWCHCTMSVATPGVFFLHLITDDVLSLKLHVTDVWLYTFNEMRLYRYQFGDQGRHIRCG